MRAMKLLPGESRPQDDASAAMRRWTERQRERLLYERLDRLTVAIERLVAILGRRAA